jgi:hypothetical protein
MNGDSPRESKLITKHELVELAIATIRRLTPVEKAKLRIQLREHYNLPPQIEPLVHGDFETLEEFKPKIPPSNGHSNHNGNGNGNGNSED